MTRSEPALTALAGAMVWLAMAVAAVLAERRPSGLGVKSCLLPVASPRPDGKCLASGSDDMPVCLWDLELAHLLDQAGQTARRNLSCSEWRATFGADQPYCQTWPVFAPPVDACK